ncbi:MAG: hypothetical protein Q8O67_32340 [Deltaproteobacteria bacterium]|nr:hypothetical protein [Deltaproteobacteria bacterium]
MSSDAYRSRVVAVEGRDVVFEVRPTTAGGLCDRPSARGFFAMLLADHGGPLTIDQATDPTWLAAHIDDHITALKLEGARGHQFEKYLRDEALGWQIPVEHLQPCFTFRVTMADEERAACFDAGSGWEGTTAYDPWGDDPQKTSFNRSYDDAAPFAPFPDLPDVDGIAAALLPLLPGWKNEPLLGLHRETDVARLRLWIYPGSNKARPGFEVHPSVDVMALSKLESGPKRGTTPSPTVLKGTLRPAATRYWLRGYVAASDDAVPEMATFLDDVQIEDAPATLARLARALQGPAVDALLTRDGVIALVEHLLAEQPAKQKAANHARLGTTTPPALGPRWVWNVDTDLLWQRVALHAGIGSREDAKKALEQAQAKSKKPPKELKALIAALST